MEELLNQYVAGLTQSPLMWLMVSALILYLVSWITRFFEIDFIDLAFVWFVMIGLYVFLAFPWWLAFLSGIVVAFLFKIIIIYPFREKMSYSTIASTKTLIGQEGELMTTISGEETGQVRLVLSSGVENFPCKIETPSAKTLHRGEKVVIVFVDEKKNIVYVKEALDHDWDEF